MSKEISKMSKERTITLCSDGAIVRLHNRRISIVVKDDKVIMHLEKPKEIERGVQRVDIAFSKEAMDGIMQALDYLKKEKIL